MYEQDVVRPDLGGARRLRAAGRARAALRRPAPGARGDEPAGVRGASPERPSGAAPRPDAGDDGPQRPDPGRLGVAGGVGYVLEYTGEAIRALSMEARMTICNMSIEGGARAGMIAPDDVTFAYLEGRPAVPTGAAWEQALDRWRALRSDDDAVFDRT